MVNRFRDSSRIPYPVFRVLARSNQSVSFRNPVSAQTGLRRLRSEINDDSLKIKSIVKQGSAAVQRMILRPLADRLPRPAAAQ